MKSQSNCTILKSRITRRDRVIKEKVHEQMIITDADDCALDIAVIERSRVPE